MKTSGVSWETKFGLLVFLGHPTVQGLSMCGTGWYLVVLGQYGVVPVDMRRSQMCWNRRYGHNRDFSLAIESAVFYMYQNTADSRTRLNFENCDRICDFNSA